MKPVATNQIVIPHPSQRRFYGHGLPGVDLDQLAGKLIVVEGADGSGRSTQIAMLVQWLEGGGHATVQEAWFDQTWGGYRNMIKLDAGSSGPHRVKLELLEEKAAESTGHQFRLLCLGTAG